MPAFNFRAVDPTGKPQRGVVEAANAPGARKALRDRNLIPVSVHLSSEKDPQAGRGEIDLTRLFGPRIGARPLAAMTRLCALR